MRRWSQTNVGGGHVALQLQGAQVHRARAKVGGWGHGGLALREGSMGRRGEPRVGKRNTGGVGGD